MRRLDRVETYRRGIGDVGLETGHVYRLPAHVHWLTPRHLRKQSPFSLYEQQCPARGGTYISCRPINA